MEEKVTPQPQGQAAVQPTQSASPVANAPSAQKSAGSVLKSFGGAKKGGTFKKTILPLLGALLVVVAGVGTGFYLSGKKVAKSQTPTGSTAPGAKQTATEAGINDSESFPDEAEGVLKEGGIEGEGTYHLERGSGPEQYAYLTSTVIDLKAYVDKKVQVKGQTIAANSAPWLMDVGYIKVIE